MSTYMGFGFNADKVASSDLLNFVKKYDEEGYCNLIDQIAVSEELDANCTDQQAVNEIAEKSVADWMDVTGSYSDVDDDDLEGKAYYISDIINEFEKDAEGVEEASVPYGPYVMLNNASPDETLKEVFVKMIEKYFSADQIEFVDIVRED